MEITLSDSTTKKFSPLVEELNEDNYFTWKYLTLLTVESLGMEDHLNSSKIPAQFIVDDTKKTTTESKTYKTWKYPDYLAKIRKIIDSLKAIGYEIRDDDHIHAIMDGLPDEYTVYTTSIITQMRFLRVPEAELSLIAFDEMAEMLNLQLQ
ncbi:hypothetical protein PIB30_032246 [Stylosanthes scabra]|uniref:Uncharacterized protein n=1 Tax=Stylosanthes scabra TaxID=79078 RepID=A0ABU6VAZ6_9FABA|nr:hypothetical protein [Stylosanthes scabra]